MPSIEDIKGELKAAKAQIKVLEHQNAELERDLAQKPIPKKDKLPENAQQLQQMVKGLKTRLEGTQREKAKEEEINAELQKKKSKAEKDYNMLKTALEDYDIVIQLPLDLTLSFANLIQDAGFNCSIREFVIDNLRRLHDSNQLTYTERE